jgi:hypothetical protein
MAAMGSSLTPWPSPVPLEMPRPADVPVGLIVHRCGAVLRGEGEVGGVGEISSGAAGRATMSLVW